MSHERTMGEEIVRTVVMNNNSACNGGEKGQLIKISSFRPDLIKIASEAQKFNFPSGGASHDWIQIFKNRIDPENSRLNEWHAMDSLESCLPPPLHTIRNKPTERDEAERVIRTALKSIMMSVDLDEVTSKYIRGRLEEHLDMDLSEYKAFIDEEMLLILGQIDGPTEIFDHVYLGTKWNASNLEELQKNGVRHILNVTREIDNFFPGMFDYCNVRVYDDEETDLLKHWDNTFKYISRVKTEGSKVLVHCKMGISRSASVVIAYAMKAYNWNFDQAITHVKEKRNCVKPSKSFVTQLETYQGILDAMKNKEKLERSKSDTNLKSDKDGKIVPRRQQFKKPVAVTSDETTDKKRRDSQQVIGKVKSLQITFEAKANENISTCGDGSKKNCQSMPSSPIAIHVDVSTDPNNSCLCSNTEDVKTLIDRYDGVAKMRTISSSPNIRQRPRSLFETKFMKTFQQKPPLINHQTILQKGELFKQLSIPTQQTMGKTALMASNQNVKNVNCRKTQQHGKTHPLTMLNANK